MESHGMDVLIKTKKRTTMLKNSILLLIVMAFCSNLRAQTKEVWMFGPMLHFNFGDDKVRASFGIELSYWNYESFPYSFDAGLEFEKKKIRIYSEAQCGVGVAGISAGPVMEFRTDETKLNLGFQGSLWGNYFLGFDLRYRAIAGGSYFCPGTYFKLPLGIGYFDSDDDNDGDSDGFGWDD